MSKSYMQLELGGKLQGLKFVVGTLYKARDADALAQNYIGKVEEDIRQLSVIIYAALLSNYKSKKQDQDFTFDDVLVWAEELETTQQIVEITDAFLNINRGLAPQEGGADTQLQAATHP